MNKTGIARVNGAPDWTEIAVIPIDYMVHPTEAKIKAFAQIAYDDTALYLHLSAEEQQIRAEMRDPLGQTCDDSCLEFFFRPDPKQMRYFNFEYNLNCVPFVGVGNSIDDLVRLFPLEETFHAHAERTEGGWEVFYQVPFSFIRVFFPEFAPKTGDILLANFYKCGDETEIPHYFAWKKPADRRCGFHCPELFGELEFE